MFTIINPPPKDFLYDAFLVLCLGVYEYQSVRHSVADATSCYISVVPHKISPFVPVHNRAYLSARSRGKRVLIQPRDVMATQRVVLGNHDPKNIRFPTGSGSAHV